MGVKVRQQPGKSGWWVFINYQNKRKKKRFSEKKVATDFAKKIEAKIKWDEANGSPVLLSQTKEVIPTVKAYTFAWLKTYVASNCKPSTAASYRQVCEKHLYPTLGAKRLDEVTRGNIKQLVATWTSQGLKKRTILNILTPLREAFNHAIDDGVASAIPWLRSA